MPPDDQDPPAKLEEAFDLSTPKPLDWEVARIRQEVRKGNYLVSQHAFTRAQQRGINPREIRRVILDGEAVSKDIPGNPHNRKPGINFEGTLDDGRRFRIKVTWHKGYVVVTVHEVGA